MTQRFGDALSALQRFALAPASARPLAALRLGIAGVLIAEALEALPALFALYGDQGVLVHGTPVAPGVFHHVVAMLSQLGVREAQSVGGASGAYVLALGALLLGYRTRGAAGAAWALHALLFGGSPGTRHGADELATMALFYLMWMPSGAALSMDQRRGRAPGGPTASARLGLRLLQLHLCLVQGSSGVEKARGEVWWNGEAVWRALMLPEHRRFDFSFLASYPWIPAVLGWAVMLLEIAYPVLVWPRRTRVLLVTLTSLLHLGVAAFTGLGAWSAVMIVLTIAAFGVRAEPDRKNG